MLTHLDVSPADVDTAVAAWHRVAAGFGALRVAPA
jgi:hypothetical protein